MVYRIIKKLINKQIPLDSGAILGMNCEKNTLHNPERTVPIVKHDIGVTVRLDWDTLQELDRIALFEHDKRAPLLRRIIVEKVQVYMRNPAYKRFLKKLEKQTGG